MNSIHSIVRDAEQNYQYGSTKLGRYVDHSMHDTIEKIDAYLNSKHISGETDSLGRKKPFFNICVAAVNIWYRATDIDRKDIRFFPTKRSNVLLAFVANMMLQNWMRKSNFGQFLNLWGRAQARYGGIPVKFVEKGGELIPSVMSWSLFVPDPVDFKAIPRIEKIYLTPAQLTARATKGNPEYMGYDIEVAKSLITAKSTRKTADGTQKDSQDDFIELYEVHGEIDTRLLDEKPNLNIKDEDIKFTQQMHVVSYLASQENTDKFDDYTLFKGKEKIDPYLMTSLIEEEGRTLPIGAVEYLFPAQWMQNHTMKNVKDTLDISSKLIFQTADDKYAGRNVLSAIETGDIFHHKPNMPLTRLANDKPDITAYLNFGAIWRDLGQEITNTPDLTRGISQAQPLTFGLGQILNTNSNSLFELMTENRGMEIDNMMRTFIIPFLKKKLENKDEIVGILDDAGITEIDSIYIPKAAVKNFNNRGKEAVLKGEIPDVFDRGIEEDAVKQSLSSLGNNRFFRPDELNKKMWSEILKDFEWDSLRTEVTNEEVDKQAVLQTLFGLIQMISANPQALQDKNVKMLFNAVLNETGRISPIQLSQSSPALPEPITK